MRYAPCLFCGSVTSFDLGDPVCGTCEILMSDVEQREQLDREFELDQERRRYDAIQRSVREENDFWESDADHNETVLYEEELRQQMEEDDQGLYTNRLRDNFRRVYMGHEQQEGENRSSDEEELYENDQDDFDFDLSYQDNIQAIRNDLSTRPFEITHDRAAIVRRLLRVLMTEENNSFLEDDASQAKGATEFDTAILKTRTLEINDLGRNAECAICTEQFEYLELTQLPCNHEYHSECIQHWLKLNASCPICRSSISRAQPEPQLQEEEPDIIIIRREAADRIRQIPISFLDDVD